MTARQNRTEPNGIVIDLRPQDLDRMARTPLRNVPEVARIQALAEEVGRQLLEERDGEPGFFPYAPDPIAADLIESAFKRGMELGRRLERQDGGQIAVSWGPAVAGDHEDAPPPAGGVTGKWFVVALIVGALAYFGARIIQSGGAA